MLILGIDPGFAIVGYGLLEVLDGKYSSKGYGSIVTSKKLSLSKRLDIIYTELIQLIKEMDPDVVAIEELFLSKNTKTAISVSHARGVILLSCVHENRPVFEYTPLEVKQGITGFGRADKGQVIRMVSHILSLDKPPTPDDAADALAIAICHANHMRHSWVTKKSNETV